MLKRRLQSKELQDKCTFQFAKYDFENYVDRLAAEYILLGQSEFDAIECIIYDLRYILMSPCVFREKDLDGELIKRGRFITHDPRRAAEVLYERTVGFWHRQGPKRTDAQKVELTRYGLIVRRLLTKICYVTPSPETLQAIENESFRSTMFLRLRESEIFVRIITRQIKRGDDLVKVFTELKNNVKRENLPSSHVDLTPEDLNPFTKKLIDYRDGQAILHIDDPESPEFIMAFVAAMSFALPKHRTVFLARMATLLESAYT